ncbi:PD-(D/E)XK nuclease family protein [bacterium]|nr:PD-(D/E)XK nuclease family protein [candidate division CSSED10-310 bacterium]
MSLFEMFKKSKPLQPMKTSPGKLRTYLQCPLKYNFQYVLGNQGSFMSNANLVFDGILKKSIETYQEKLLFQMEDIAENTLRSLIMEAWDPHAFSDLEDHGVFIDAAQNTAKAMTEWFALKSGTPMTYNGKPAVGIFACIMFHPITVWCRIDRVDRLVDGRLRVVAFKSGAREMDKDQIRFDLTARLQAAAAVEQFGSGIQQFTMVFLRTGTSIDVDIESMNLGKLEKDVHQIAKNIQAGAFPTNPGPLCSTCEFMEQCPAWVTLPWDIACEDRYQYSKRLRLSYSKMSLFERCPRAYKKLYVDGIPPKPQPFFSFGSCIHAVMEVFYDENIKTKRSKRFLLEILEEKWADFTIGYHDETEASMYKAKAVEMLENYYDSFVATASFHPAEFIESYFEIPVGTRAVMTGFIDRIDKIDNRYILLDYKTEPTERSQESVDSDLQLTLYYWAAKNFLGINVDTLGLYMMAHNTLLTTRRKPEDVDVLLERIKTVTNDMLTESTFEPRINKYCLSCDHLEGCPLETEIRKRGDLRSMAFQEDA